MRRIRPFSDTTLVTFCVCVPKCITFTCRIYLIVLDGATYTSDVNCLPHSCFAHSRFGSTLEHCSSSVIKSGANTIRDTNRAPNALRTHLKHAPPGARFNKTYCKRLVGLMCNYILTNDNELFVCSANSLASVLHAELCLCLRFFGYA